jgi:holo-[acyl-carrier protein] synthase
MSDFSIGTDIEEIIRFSGKSRENDKAFLNRIYTEAELDYCYKSSNYSQHLCGRYCVKEAVVKALSEFDIKDVFYSDIEVFNKESGMPYVKIEKHPDMNIKVSLSHCKTYATATALIIKEN